MKNFPYALRLSLLAVLSPIGIAMFSLLGTLYYYGAMTPTYETFGVSWATWFSLIHGVLPLSMLLLVFVKGYWRLALFLLITVPWVALMISTHYVHVKPENRKIELNAYYAMPSGTEVFCNGVRLGTVPMDITVAELKKKVAEATAPPEQRWFVDGKTPIYSQLPWDDFIKERFEERFLLDPQKSPTAFDVKSKYWWSFKIDGVETCVFNNGGANSAKKFDDAQSYNLTNLATPLIPSRRAHADLLSNILADDKFQPTPEWIKHTANYADQLLFLLRIDDKESRKKINAAVIRCRYGLSDKPTAEECDKALQRIMEDNRRFSVFYKHNRSNYGRVCVCNDLLVDIALREMGDACKEPLLRRFRSLGEKGLEHYDNDQGFLLYTAGIHCFPELFDELVRIFGTEKNGFDVVMRYSDPRVVPLFQTALERVIDPLNNPRYRNQQKAGLFEYVNNPMLEPLCRAYLAEWLPDFYDYHLGETLTQYVAARLKYDWIDRAELARWVESLRINGAFKTVPLNRIRWAGRADKETLGEKVFPDDPELAKKLTETTLNHWVERNPKRFLEDFVVELDGSLTEQASGVKNRILEEMISRNKPEAESIVKILWANPEIQPDVLEALRNINASFFFDDQTNEAMKKAYQNRGRDYTVDKVRLPGVYGTFRRSGNFVSEVEEKPLPSYFVPLFAELDDVRLCSTLTPLVRSVESPEAVALLKKWSSSESTLLKRRATESLEILSQRVQLKENRRKLFTDLVSGKLTPDDLIEPPKPFEWNGEKYIEKR